MLRTDLERWNQTVEELRAAGYRAEHARTREQFLALDEIARGGNATQVAVPTGGPAMSP